MAEILRKERYSSGEAKNTRACIFDIQRFSIHDGPGIRTTLFFKGCPLRCRWCQNPESHNPGPEVAFYTERCVGCFACKEVCPDEAIVESQDIRIDHKRCDACGKCVSECTNRALRRIGEWWEAGPLLEEVLKDRDFFEDSDGGITLSGGEPAFQVEFLREFLPLIKDEGIHVNMETCGMFRWDDVKKILSHLDIIYFDLKFIESGMHKKFTGRDNRTIIDNYVELAKIFPNLEARMPVIPTINDSPENIIEIARFLKDNKHKSIHLLPYHKLGEAKLPRIKTDLRPLNLKIETLDYLSSAKDLFESEGICPILYDQD
jgi:pyruvate formate lyase activating enzyme